MKAMTFEIGKNYTTSTNALITTNCKVVAKDETRKTITIVEEYETMQVEIPYKKVVDPRGIVFEVAKYLGEYIFARA